MQSRAPLLINIQIIFFLFPLVCMCVRACASVFMWYFGHTACDWDDNPQLKFFLLFTVAARVWHIFHKAANLMMSDNAMSNCHGEETEYSAWTNVVKIVYQYISYILKLKGEKVVKLNQLNWSVYFLHLLKKLPCEPENPDNKEHTWGKKMS